jgi:hypothetical protein
VTADSTVLGPGDIAHFLDKGHVTLRACFTPEAANEYSKAEATGEVGDVYLIHPLVLHTMSPNGLRRARFITNSTLRLAEPMRFNRPDPADHSPVERAILRGLGVERFDFTATWPRERVVPEPL